MTSLKKDNGETRCLFYLRIWRRITMFTRDFLRSKKAPQWMNICTPSWEAQAHCSYSSLKWIRGQKNNDNDPPVSEFNFYRIFHFNLPTLTHTFYFLNDQMILLQNRIAKCSVTVQCINTTACNLHSRVQDNSNKGLAY